MSQKGVQRFYYDYRNQLVRVIEGTTNTNLKYDALGRRIEKSTGSDTVKYYYDRNQVIEERGGSDQIKRQLIYGNGVDELLIIFNYDGATAIPYYVHTNDIGSITAITNQEGNIVERVSYDTYGMPTFTDYQTDPLNPTVLENSVIGNDILFQGRRYDKDMNLMYFRARYFDPIMGRFLQTDPIGYRDSMNLYQAFNQNPVNFIDPFGRNIFEDLCNADWGFFFGETGHSLWNVASLGTLNKVEQQKNLGTWGGVLQSTGSAGASISNTVTFGLQDKIYYTQMEEGAGLKSIWKGTKKAAIDITPYEEIKTIFSSDVGFSEKISSIFAGIAKTAGLVGMYKTLKTPSNPKSQSLENFQARKWYLKKEKAIHKNIDKNLSIKQKGSKAFEQRNKIRTKTRETMADRKLAKKLNETDPNMSLKQIIKKYYKKGFVGDDLWNIIYEKAVTSRPWVNLKMDLQFIFHYLFFAAAGVTNQ
jgi:RHS repeat-associated protein